MPETIIGDASPVHQRWADMARRQRELSVAEQMAVEQFEGRLREDYRSLFPSQTGWETAALYFLLAYEFRARQQPNTETVDTLKYALMHALRWGAETKSQPIKSLSADVDPNLFSDCYEVLRRANEYTGIYGAFRLFKKGIVGLDTISEQDISFKSNPQWNAYDALDRQLQERPHSNRNRPETMTGISRIVDNVLLYFDFRDYLPNINDFCDALPAVRQLADEGFELPESWSFDGIPIATMRKFWTAMMLLGIVHNAVSHRSVGSKNPHLCHLLIRRKKRLVGWLADSLKLDRALVTRLIDLHTYNRQQNLPDIALTPLLEIDNDLLALSPWMVLTSRFERNFSAFVARNYKSQYDATTNDLASVMAAQLAGTFRAAGLKACPSVPIRTNKGDGDIDLLVWSPEEKYALGVELKWVIGVGDVMEVFNRGESTCLASITKQIPKYREALSHNAGGLLQRAFSLGEAPAIDAWCCALMTRGFVGSPRVVNDQCLFIPEQLALEKLASRCSLQDFCEWAKAMPYLPVEGREFRLTPVSITSSSGLAVTFWERDRIESQEAGK